MTRGKLRPTSGPAIVLTPDQTAELQALAALPDDQINTRDAPEQRDWSGARRGFFFAPSKSS
jgi:hypothetical protein